MITTYMIECENNTVIGYEETLADAKQHCKRFSGKYITQLKGQYKYEGFHQYILELNDDKFDCIWSGNLSKRKVK